jgi:hypothetical protein
MRLAAPHESANTVPEIERRTFRPAAVFASPAASPAMAWTLPPLPKKYADRAARTLSSGFGVRAARVIRADWFGYAPLPGISPR